MLKHGETSHHGHILIPAEMSLASYNMIEDVEDPPTEVEGNAVHNCTFSSTKPCRPGLVIGSQMQVNFDSFNVQIAPLTSRLCVCKNLGLS